MQCTTQADTICFSFFDLGVERPVAAELTYGEKKEVKKVRLPYREPFNQAVTDYRFKIPETGYETTIASAALDSKLELNCGIRKDSFCVSFPILCSWNFPGMCIKATACCRKVREKRWNTNPERLIPLPSIT